MQAIGPSGQLAFLFHWIGTRHRTALGWSAVFVIRRLRLRGAAYRRYLASGGQALALLLLARAVRDRPCRQPSHPDERRDFRARQGGSGGGATDDGDPQRGFEEETDPPYGRDDPKYVPEFAYCQSLVISRPLGVSGPLNSMAKLNMAEHQLTAFEHVLLGLVCLSPASGYAPGRRGFSLSQRNLAGPCTRGGWLRS
jgi:hypothetical protein